MTPIKSSTNKESCSPISSNCVIWQGPNLPCINLCSGDSVSDVVYRLADELCKIKANFNLTDVDLECILTVCQATPEPAKTIGNILNLIINKVCCLSDIVNSIDLNGPDEVEVQLASCFKPFLNPQGVPLQSLPHSQYTYLIGVKLCETITTVNTHTAQIAGLQSAVTTLQNAPIYTTPQISTECLTGGGITPGTPADIDAVLDELEKQYCLFTAAVGSVADINTTIAKECKAADGTTLGNQPSLVNPSNTMAAAYSGANGWVNAAANLAQSLRNMWITVCDLRGAVKLIQDNCCKVTCEDIVIAFDVIRLINADGDFAIKLFFGPTVLPSTWYDCNQTPQTNLTVYPKGWTGNKIKITDSAGHVREVYIQLRNTDLDQGILQDDLSLGYEIVLEGTNIDESLDFTITGDICVTDGVSQCVKCIAIDVPYTPVGDCCTITATDTVSFIYKTCN